MKYIRLVSKNYDNLKWWQRFSLSLDLGHNDDREGHRSYVLGVTLFNAYDNWHWYFEIDFIFIHVSVGFNYSPNDDLVENELYE